MTNETHTQQDSGHPNLILPDDLSTKVSLKWWQILGPWYIENRFTYPIRKFAVRNPIFLKIILFFEKVINSQFIQLRRFIDGYEKSYSLLTNKNDDGYGLDSEFGYDGDVFFNELSRAHKYKNQIDQGFNGPSESKKLYEHIIKTSTRLLQTEAIRSQFNFGVSYAYTDSILAQRFPHIKFYGIERTDAAKIYNERFFSDIENLEILSGDVFDLFSKQRFENGVFFHSRTLLLLPKDFIRKLYSAVKSAGFTYIFGTEQYGVSRQTYQSYDFSFDAKDSVVYRDFMYIHNYPHLLAEAGFELQEIDSIRTDHPHDDFRILSFVAKSKGA